MNKLQYFFDCVRNEVVLHRAWVLVCFSKPAPDQSLPEVNIKIDGEGKLIYTGGEEPVNLPQLANGHLYELDERVKVKKGDMACIKEDMETTYGLLLYNALMVNYPYGEKGTYINKRFTDKVINAYGMEQLLREDVAIEEHIAFEDSIGHIEGFIQLSTPSGSRKSMVPAANVIELRDKLLTKHKHELDDPVIISYIQNKLIELDRKNLEGDSSMKFLIKEKNFRQTRLQLMGMFGAEADFYDETKIQTMFKSLYEGWTHEEIVMMVNSIRSGSRSRGEETALGGVEVKNTSRVASNYNVEGEDCGSKHGFTLKIHDSYKELLLGRTIVGNKSEIKQNDIDRYVGKTVTIRSPSACNQPGARICKTCIGSEIHRTGRGLGSYVNATAATFVAIMLAKMHGSSLETQEIDLDVSLS